MKKYFLIAGVSLAFLCICYITFNKSVTIPESATFKTTADGLWLIEWHTNSTWLSYAVINGPSLGEAHGHVRAGGSASGKQWAYLLKPDGREIPILDSGRIFQVSGTNVTETSSRISAGTFQAFLKSPQSNYSLSTLLQFAGIEK